MRMFRLCFGVFILGAIASVSPAWAAQVTPLGNSCFVSDWSLDLGFAKKLPRYGVAHFEMKNKWQQLVVLPAEGQWGVDASGVGIDTEFMGPHKLQRAPVTCSIETLDAPATTFNLTDGPCPDAQGTVIDSGPEARVRQIYFDGLHLRMVFTIVERQWGNTGIYEINDQLWVSIDGNKRVIPIHGYEPLTTSIDVAVLPRMRHTVLFGTEGTSNGGVCL